MQIHHFRNGLQRTRHALQNGSVTLGFIGGSITDGRVNWNWSEPVIAWFTEKFPGVRVQIENAAIGATGSDLAVFRAQRDLLNHGCDLVFVEFAVNDDGSPPPLRRRTREGLLRKLLAGEGCDIVLVYTFLQSMYADMAAGKQPASIAEFEELAHHYKVGSVWMGLNALQEVMAGKMRWEEWLPDGLHPQYRGSLSYAQSVIAFLEKELCTQPDGTAIPAGKNLPAPLDEQNWQDAYILPFSQVKLDGPWTLRRWNRLAWIDQVLFTAAVGAKFSFSFQGCGLCLGFDFGKASAEFRFRLDGGDWKPSKMERPDWCGIEGWYRLFIVAEDLPRGTHTFELEVCHGNPDGDFTKAILYTGTNFNLGLIGVIP